LANRAHLWAPFNTPELAVSYSKDGQSFNNHAVNDNNLPPLISTIPSDAQCASVNIGVKVLYYFHQQNNDPANLVGSAVIDVDSICPAFLPLASANIFGHYFGIKFQHDGHSYVHAISPFEFVLCF
jgi:hypothetical protein